MTGRHRTNLRRPSAEIWKLLWNLLAVVMSAREKPRKRRREYAVCKTQDTDMAGGILDWLANVFPSSNIEDRRAAGWVAPQSFFTPPIAFQGGPNMMQAATTLGALPQATPYGSPFYGNWN